MKVFLRGELQHMADAEMREMLDETAMAFIKGQDPTPAIKVFEIAHEGVAGGKLAGRAVQGIRYFQDAVRKVIDRLPIGTSIFDGHNDDNSHAGRSVIGQVVGKALKEIGGKLHAIAAAYIKPTRRDGVYDCASIETNMLFEPQDDGIRLVDLDEITGIALGDSTIVSPGFRGATLLGAFQAFGENLPKEKGGSTMTRDEIKAAIREGSLKPSDVFEDDDLFRDAAVGRLLQTEVLKGKDLTTKLGEARSKMETTEATANATINSLKAEVLKVQHRPMFDTLAVERKLDSRQKQFLDQRFQEFKTDADNEDGAKTALGTWINDGLKKFDETAKIFMDGGSSNGDGKQPGASMGAPVGDKSSIDRSNASDPKVNPLIPGGEAAKAAGL